MQNNIRKSNTGSSKEQQPSVAVVLMLFIAISLFLVPSAVSQPNIDYWTPDSAYYRGVQIGMINCTDSVEIRLPVFLWSDDASLAYFMDWTVSGAIIDTAFAHLLRPCSYPFYGSFISSTRDTCYPGILCESWEQITPGNGIAMEVVLRSKLGQSFTCRLIPNAYFRLDAFGIYSWSPLYLRLDSTFTIPPVIDFGAGDVDCSGNVTISDAVFAIQYIFAGGCSPYDSEAADPNGDCSITISDAVYLINFIFAGGPPPQAGCVGF